VGVIAGESGPPSPGLTRRDTAFFGHPKALSTLFFTEMWERFSYYGMRAILAYYLVHELAFDKPSASSLVAVYSSAIYLTGVAGGWLADRLIGAEKATLWGGVLIMFGHIALATPGRETSLYIGIFFLVIGTGLLKPNINGIVGNLYSRTDSRRDAGFTIFYFSVNLGALVGQLLTGYLGDKVGWHWGFGAAAVGMALGLIQYVVGRKGLPEGSGTPSNPLTEQEKASAFRNIGVMAAGLAGLVVLMLLFGWFTPDGIGYVVTAISVILPIVYITNMSRSPYTDKEERDRLMAYIPLFVSSVIFWLLFEQQANVLALWTEERVDLTIGGWDMPPAWTQSINSLFVIIFALFFAGLWTKLGDRQPSTPIKFGMAMLLAGVSYFIMVAASVAGGPGTRVTIMWLVIMLLVLTLGELCLSPVGLSATTKLAPRAFKSQTLGLWFLSPAAGSGIGAQVVKLYAPETESVYFGVLAGVSVLAGLLLFANRNLIRKYMRGVP
jgi:POT family proton-dependent oligopeptide transporter